MEKVANSISKFGFNSPILISKDGTIAAGHTRLRAAEHLNLPDVPVIVLDLTDDQIAAFRIADNKTAEFSFWDFELLREELLELDDSLRLHTGFDPDELAHLFNEGDVLSLDDLEKEFGEHDDSDGWPEIKLKVPPEVKQMWDSTMAASGGGTDAQKLDRALRCVDMEALRNNVE